MGSSGKIGKRSCWLRFFHQCDQIKSGGNAKLPIASNVPVKRIVRMQRATLGEMGAYQWLRASGAAE
jgi:hypothetical protein